MESTGKYVRIPSEDGDEENDSLDRSCSSDGSINDSSGDESMEEHEHQEDALTHCAEHVCTNSTSEQNGDAETSAQNVETDALSGKTNQSVVTAVDTMTAASMAADTNARLDILQKAVIDLAQMVREKVTVEPNPTLADQAWTSNLAPLTNAPIKFDNIPPFPKTDKTTCMWEVFTRYLEKFEIAITLNGITNSAQQAQLLYLALGDELQAIIRASSLRPSLSDPDCYKHMVENISNYFRAMTDVTAEHDKFVVMKQRPGESAAAFRARLVTQARVCNYSEENKARFVKSQFLKGMANRELARTARIFDCDTEFLVQSATRCESFEEDESTSRESVMVVGTSKHRRDGQRKHDQQWSGTRNNQRGSSNGPPAKRRNVGKQENGSDSNRPGKRKRCSRCDRPAHNGGQCPALNKSCRRCDKLGHFEACCRQKLQIDQLSQQITPKPEDEEQQYINALTLQDILISCKLDSSSPIKFMIDSGADANIIGGKDWEQLQEDCSMGLITLRKMKLLKNTNLKAYAAMQPLHVECAFTATVTVVGTNSSPTQAEFLVVPNGNRSLLGRVTSSDMNLLKVGPFVNHCGKDDEMKAFPKMPGVKVRFSIDRSVPPERNAYYNVPAAFREGAKLRLQEMEERGIIEKVTSAPEWISGMSAVAKGKNDFRLVVNMRGPNKAIKREYFRLPLIHEMKVKLHGAKFFTKLDLTSAYHHLELAKDSRDLTTFLSESGMYRFTRLMFGVNCAPEIFQREMVRILDGIENVIVYIDDILVFASSIEELHKTVTKVLRILRSNNLSLNLSKCEFDKDSIQFLGHQLDENGFHVEDAKIRSVHKFREPATASELRSFLGLAAFLSPYIQSFAEITSALWEVATTKSWTWGTRQSEAFEAVKQKIIHCTATLGYFSNEDKTILYTDASPVALGAVLVQENRDGTFRIISFASKALTSTEKRYAQNQREALGAVWGVEHFSYYLLGRRFTLRTDARGVAFIFNRSREDTKRALNRADGWALRLTPYDYVVEFVAGRFNIADPSSRLYVGDDGPFDETVSPWEIARLEANIVGFLTEDEIKQATLVDSTLTQVSLALETGVWPKNLHKFEALAENLHANDGLIIKEGRVIIPDTLRHKALQIAHEGHPMAGKLKTILRERVWWPGMSKDAENWVKSCQTCVTNGQPEKTTPMERIFAPKNIWETIAIDFNGPYSRFGGISILVVVEYRSRYIYAYPVKSTSFEQTRSVLDIIFDREGFPKNIKTDNGPPFNGQEYAEYCAGRGIRTIYSTPLFPQQNGLVERYMKLINKAMATAVSNSTPYPDELKAAVTAHNSAAHTITKVAPEEMMNGRKIHRGLPLISRGKVTFDDELIDQRDRVAKLDGKTREDVRRGANKCQVLPGDCVIVERQSRAKGDSRFDPKKFTVLEQSKGNLLLSDDDGQTLRRHVSQTKKVHDWRASPAKAVSPDVAEPHIRQSRNRRAPSYLEDYIRLVEQENMDMRNTLK